MSGAAITSEQARGGGKVPQLRLRVRPAAEAKVRRGHPWVFDESITDENRSGQLGELAVIYDKRNRFLAVGLFDPESPLRIRILHSGSPVRIDKGFWILRLSQAIAKRESVSRTANGYRLIHGESDGFPGLVLDRYDSTLVLKLYTAAWFERLQESVAIFQETLEPARMVLRLSRNIQGLAQGRFHYNDGEVIRGKAVTGPVVFEESGLRLEADVLRGQKTGFFLDQRENRQQVGKVVASRGIREVLNAFSFSGGFSLYAAANGARAVVDLDMSAHALESAKRNFELNRERKSVSACVHETIQADAFDWLAQSKRKFGMVILDPPALARRASEREEALRAYGRLIASGIRCTRPGGVLVASSCSAQVKDSEFFEAARHGAKRIGRTVRELMTSGQPQDHPAAFPEAKYLKTIYLQA